MEKRNFITATKEYNTFEKHVPAPYIRKSFLSDTDTTAELCIAVCGFYELYVNGKRYTKGLLAPYISNTDDYIYYDKYTVPIDEGENVVGILLGNGLQNNPGGHIWDFDKAEFRSAPMMSLTLRYKSKNGEEVAIESDTSFKTAPSPIIFDDYRFGEHYDANAEIKGWNEKGFDDKAWSNALDAKPPRGELRLCEADPIVKETEIKPVKIIKAGDGYIYDFGVNHSGVCKLCVNGEKGQKIEMQHGEILHDGKLFLENVWFVREHWERDKEIVHKDIYICGGGGEEVYTPTFTYHGFRYVYVTGITPEQATEELLTYEVIHSDLKVRGGFTCSDETVNKIQEIVQRSDISNFHYFPTDCPHREKNGWTADAALSCEQLLLNFAPEASYAEWLRNICKAQDKSGALPGIIPTGGWGFEWGNGPSWDSILACLPYYVYIYSGKTDVIKESSHALMSYLDYLTTVRDEKGLIHIGLPGDWCPADRAADDPKAPLELTDTLMSMDIAKKAAFMFDVIGKNAQSKFAADLAEDLRKSIRENLIDFDTMTVREECQTSQAICIYYGVFEPCEEEKAFERMVEFIRAEDDKMDVGVLGARTMFRVLSRFGRSDLAFKMITRPDYPSYGYLIESGDTTLRELFSKCEVAGSMNHHFWGDVSAWFIKYLAGIRFNPNRNNIREVEIRPCFVDALDNAEGYFTAPDGKIVSSWKKNGGKVTVSLTIPEQISAKMRLQNGFAFEDGSTSKEVCAGEYVVLKQEQGV